MKVVWFTWKDNKHPFAGGAEVVTNEICTRLVAEGNEVVLIVAGFGECVEKERINGYTVVRVGERFSVYWRAYKYYKQYLVGWADIVIEEVNIVPFFTQFYIKDIKRVIFIHQLGREIWWYQIQFPLSFIGYLIEPLYLYLISDNFVITVSKSTKNNLVKFGFDRKRIQIITEGLDITAIKNIHKTQKFTEPTILSFGEVRAMKRTVHVIKTFEVTKKYIPNLKLIVAGSTNTAYGMRVLRRIQKSKFKDDIQVYGYVSSNKKQQLMRKSHVVVMTSVKEGWGLVVTEANSQGTPCVVYNVDGLCDSVKHNITGLVCAKNTPKNLSDNIIGLLNNKTKYHALRHAAWLWSQEMTFDKCYEDFMKNITCNK